MAHTQKPDFVFRRNGRVHLNRRGGGEASVQSTAGSRGVCISFSNAGYTMFRGSVKGTGYPLHLPISPSLPLPCVTVFHQVSNALYIWQVVLIPLFQWLPTWGTRTARDTTRKFRGTRKTLNNGGKRHIRQQCKTKYKSKVWSHYWAIYMQLHHIRGLEL